jgi:ribonuclease D
MAPDDRAAPRIHWIDTPALLRRAADALHDAPKLYVDTEFDSSRRGMTLSVVQVSRGADVFLIDALRLEETELFHAALGAGNAEWVLHAGSQDIGLLLEWTGLDAPPPLFDTQVAWGLLTAEATVSLAYLKYKLLGVRSAKGHQADDWLRRPLPESQLEYAAADVSDLAAMEVALSKMADVWARRALICRASNELLDVEPEPPTALTLQSFRNAWQLDSKSQAALLALIAWVNELPAADRDRAPEPKTLLAIAARMPAKPDELLRIKGASGALLRERAGALIRLIQSAIRGADTEGFVPIEPPPYATFEDVELDAWLTSVRAALCVELQVAPELVLPGRVMRRIQDAIAQGGSRAAGGEVLTGWRRELLLPKYLARCTSLS